MNKKIKIFKSIDLLLILGLFAGIITAFQVNLVLGMALLIFFTGLRNLIRFFFKQDPNMFLGIVKGFDYLIKKIFKEKFNQVYNLYAGITLTSIGFIMIFKYYGLFQ